MGTGVAGGIRRPHARRKLLIWPKRPPQEVVETLRRVGILVRSMAGKPLIHGALRVSVGTTEQMQRFWTAYQQADG